jgi:hypothetical protein
MTLFFLIVFLYSLHNVHNGKVIVPLEVIACPGSAANKTRAIFQMKMLLLIFLAKRKK